MHQIVSHLLEMLKNSWGVEEFMDSNFHNLIQWDYFYYSPNLLKEGRLLAESFLYVSIHKETINNYI